MLDFTSSVNTPKDLEPFYDFFCGFLKNREYKTINKILHDIDLPECSSLLLVGILRLLFSVRDHLPFYKTFLSDTYNELIARGLDADAALHGL